MENVKSYGDGPGEGNGAAIALDFDKTHIVPGAGCKNHYCGKARAHEASGAPTSAPTPASASEPRNGSACIFNIVILCL